MFPSFTEIFDWIETHEVTVDLLKWILLGLLAWFTGIWGYIINRVRKPKIKICSVTSLCYIEKIPESEANGRTDAARAAFLINVEVINPSSAPITVKRFEAQVLQNKNLNKWSSAIAAATLPNRVHHHMGSATKIMRNWFSKFDDVYTGTTIEGKVDPKDSESGYVLFVTATYGNWNPKVTNGYAYARVTVGLATGERYKAKGHIKVTKDSTYFEKMIPGILDQIRHPSASNIPTKFKKAMATKKISCPLPPAL